MVKLRNRGSVVRGSSALVGLPAHDPRTGKSAHQLEIRAPQNMTKRHRNLSYDISLERYESLLSTPIYGMTF